ncbi:MAG: AmmeMemoRadiSam system radical SAM enzyme [Smithella sp.]|nr:AmmeMemoRadiSam system radical SAM enzyme [Smithella sp.]
MMISRRDFLTTLAKLVPIVSGLGPVMFDPCWQKFLPGNHAGLAFGETYLDEIIRKAPRARYWTPAKLKGSSYSSEETIAKCQLCANGCSITNGQRGRCRTRMNLKGELRSLVYGRPISIHIDPIEKKPLYHYLPGSAAFSLATAGCVLKCKFCQNWEISQSSPEDHPVAFTPPASIVNAACSSKAPVIAFTYNEPTVFTEYLTDIARDAQKRGIHCVMISCGFMNEAPLQEMCNVLNAIKIDLKGFSEDFYRSACGARLQPVLRTIKQIAKSGIHLEIVNLVVPTLNDSDKMMKGLIDWILGEIGPDVPVHFTRFHPDFQLRNLPPTPGTTLQRAYDLAMSRGMHYPYVGNVPGHPGNHTYCPNCRKIVVERQGFFITAMSIKDGRCKFCKQKIAGVWT